MSNFSHRLEEELDTFQALLRLLKEEQAALVHGDVDLLFQLAARKSELLQTLGELGAERARALSASGHEDNTAGMNAWLEQTDADTETRAHWHGLLELAREAERMNRDNGILIDTLLRHNQQALSTLHQAASPDGKLYGPDGQISAGTGGRPIGKV